MEFKEGLISHKNVCLWKPSFPYNYQLEYLTALWKCFARPLCCASGSGAAGRIQVQIWFGPIPLMKLTPCNWHRHTGNLISSSCCLRAFDHSNLVVCFMYIAPPIGEVREQHMRASGSLGCLLSHIVFGFKPLGQIQEYLTSQTRDEPHT